MQTIPYELLDAYRTCELLTVGRDGTPIAWPTVALPRPDGTIRISTSIGLPRKAFNVRRDERVALLFSDPTGSGLAAPPQVLVQGTAVCPDEIVTSPEPWADLWLRIRAAQPSSAYHRVPVLRGIMDWYYMRLLITVTPTSVTTTDPYRPQPPTVAPATGSSAFASAVRRMPAFGGAVLCAYDSDGHPTMRRVHPRAGSGVFHVETGTRLSVGRASLLWHSHDAELSALRAFVVTGDLTGDGPSWTLTPSRYVSTADAMGPIAMIRTVARLRRAAAGYLARRNLSRPSIPWSAYAETERSAT